MIAYVIGRNMGMLLIGSSCVLIAPVRELRMPWSKCYANQVTCAWGDEPTVIEHVMNCLGLQPPRLSPRVTSDKASYVAHGLALLNEMRTWCVVREGRCHEKGGFFLNQYC